MQTNNPSEHNPTAAILLIGNELLSGRTQDINLAYMATRLAAHGVRVTEARIIADVPETIVSALNTLRAANTYVFTTGGIGPTHDDITADCVSDAFGVELELNAEAERRLMAYWQERGIEPNSDRLRMARIPAGGCLIDNAISVAPGFCIDNVYVLAGVPKIMQSMFDSVLPALRQGAVIASVSVKCDLGEGTLASPLRNLQSRYPSVDLGSYPGKIDANPVVTLVARSTDAQQLIEVEAALKRMVAEAGGRLIPD